MPSAKILEQKQAMLAELVETMKNSESGVLVNYCGITVEEDTKLRNDLRAAGVQYFVVKNTLLEASTIVRNESDTVDKSSFAVFISNADIASYVESNNLES